MSKLRSVSTQFWSDPWIEDLSANEKLLYLYFITNEKTNMLGVYELSIKKISFETGLNKDVIDKALKGFESVGKVKYIQNYVILLNFTKHQNYNTNMKISAIDVYNNLPNFLKSSSDTIDKSKPLEGFQMVCKRLGMVRKVEDETEYETEDEKENKNIPNWEEFLAYAVEKKPKVNRQDLRLKYESWLENGWSINRAGKLQPIQNWKTTLLNTLPYIAEVVIKERKIQS